MFKVKISGELDIDRYDVDENDILEWVYYQLGCTGNLNINNPLIEGGSRVENMYNLKLKVTKE